MLFFWQRINVIRVSFNLAVNASAMKIPHGMLDTHLSMDGTMFKRLSMIARHPVSVTPNANSGLTGPHSGGVTSRPKEVMPSQFLDSSLDQKLAHLSQEAEDNDSADPLVQTR